MDEATQARWLIQAVNDGRLSGGMAAEVEKNMQALRDQGAGLREALEKLINGCVTQVSEDEWDTRPPHDNILAIAKSALALAPPPMPHADHSPDAGKMVPAIAKDCAAELAKSNVAMWREKAELLDVALSCKNVREQIWWSFEDEGNCVPPTGADAIIGILRKELAALRATKEKAK